VEFKNFALYWGMPVLETVMGDDEHYHFRLYALSLRILETNEYRMYWGFAEMMLKQFVRDFPTVYKELHVVSCIHKLVHLVKECEKFGPLYNFKTLKRIHHNFISASCTNSW